MNSRTRIQKSAIIGFASVLFCCAATVTAIARPLEEVIESGVLRVIVYYDNKPFSWEEDGKARGIDADLGRAIAAKLKVSADIIVRTAGEEVDDDLRSNIWQGPRTGGLKGDVMMHVPMDKVLIARNNLVAISNAYYHEQIILVVNSDLVADGEGLSVFKKLDVAVQFATSGHYFLAFTDDGAYADNVSPFMNFEDAATHFRARESAGLLGRRAQLEPLMKNPEFGLRYLEPEFPTTLRGRWNIGTAVNQDSRDLGYAIGIALEEIRKSGELKSVFEKYGVSLVPPRTR